MTTGEGGIILTDDDGLAAMCVSLRNQGRGRGGGWLAHDRLGYNYRLSDINCALGIVQLSRIEEFVEKRAKVAKLYGSAYRKVEQADSQMGYAMDHSSDLYLIDKNGQLSGSIPHGTPPQKILASLRKLLK